MRAGEADDVVHGQEVRRVVELADHREFVAELGGDGLGDRLGIAPGRALPGQPLQGRLRRQARMLDLVGILVAQFGKIETAALDDLGRARDRARVAREQPRHLRRRPQMAVGEAFAAEAGGVDRAAFADAGEHVLQDAPLGCMVEHIAGRDRGDPGRGRPLGEALQAGGIVRASPQGQGEIGPVAELRPQPSQRARELVVRLVGHQDREQPVAAAREIVPVEMAGSLARRAPCRGSAAGTAARRHPGRSDRPAARCRPPDRAGSRPRGERRSFVRPPRRARCRRANCDRRSPGPRCRARPPAQTAPRDARRRAGSCSWR